MTIYDALGEALGRAASGGAVLLIGPGVEDRLALGVERRHVPGGALLPFAEGLRFAEPERPVAAVGADHDVFGAGLGALLHAARRNTGVTCIVIGNGRGPGGVANVGPWEGPLRPLALALDAGATFVAQRTRDESGALLHLVDQAMQHPGFALINIWDQPVPDEKVDLDGDGDYDKHRRRLAAERLAEVDRLYTGVIYQNPDLPPLERRLLGRARPATGDRAVEPEGWASILAEDREGG